MLSKYTIIGLIVGIVPFSLGTFSVIDHFASAIDIMDFHDNFASGDEAVASV